MLLRQLDYIVILLLMGSLNKLESLISSKISVYLYLILAIVYIPSFLTVISESLGRKAKKSVLIVCMPLFFSLLSILWTVDLGISSKALIDIFAVTYFIMVFSGRYKLYDFLKVILKCTIISAVASFFAVILIPSFGLHFGGPDSGLAWAGIFEHKNTLSRNIGFGVIILISSYIANESLIDRKLSWLFFFILTLTCIFSKSGTIILTLILCLIICWIFKFFKVTKLRLYIVALSLPILPIFMIVSSHIFNFVLELLGRNAERTTFGVREHLWESLLQYVIEKPFLGYGIKSFWGQSGLELPVFEGSDLEWVVRQAHNGYIDLYLSFGFVSFIMLVTFLSKYIDYVSNISRGESVIKYISISLLVYFLMINNSYSLLFTQVAFPWFIIGVIFIKLSRFKHS